MIKIEHRSYTDLQISLIQLVIICCRVANYLPWFNPMVNFSQIRANIRAPVNNQGRFLVFSSEYFMGSFLKNKNTTFLRHTDSPLCLDLKREIIVSKFSFKEK